MDYGLYLAYESAFEKDKDDKIEAKILLEKRVGDVKNTVNINFEQRVWNDADEDLEMGAAWKAKYYLSKIFRPGIEYYFEGRC